MSIFFTVAIFALAELFCPQFAVATVNQDSTSTKAQVHIPWQVLETRLQSASAGKSFSASIPANQLNFAGYQWTVSNANFSTQAELQTPSINESSAALHFVNGKIQGSFQVAINQTIDQNVGGTIVHVHVAAQCGPIQVTQNSAEAQTQFSITWPNGQPQANLASLNLKWRNGSWSVADFSCQGPSGMGDVLKQNILTHLNDPNQMQSLISDYVGQMAQAQLQGLLNQVRSPFSSSVDGIGLHFIVGQISPVATGVIADVTVSDSAVSASAPLPLPNASVLTQLSTELPVIIANTDFLNTVVKYDLAQKTTYFLVDLQLNSAFHKLMQSRLQQFFGWSDLINYPQNNPFYLRIANPERLALTHSTQNGLTSDFQLYTIIQSYRDRQWWSYVTLQGPTHASLTLAISAGSLTYTTNINSFNATIDYGSDYKTKYQPTGSLPKSTLTSAVVGPQKDLSGTAPLPEINLGIGGTYQAKSLGWLNGTNENMFSVTMENLN